MSEQKILCDGCGARYNVPKKAIKQAKCKKCGEMMDVAAQVAAFEDAAEAEATSDASAEAAPSKPVVRRRSNAGSEGGAERRRTTTLGSKRATRKSGRSGGRRRREEPEVEAEAEESGERGRRPTGWRPRNRNAMNPLLMGISVGGVLLLVVGGLFFAFSSGDDEENTGAATDQTANNNGAPEGDPAPGSGTGDAAGGDPEAGNPEAGDTANNKPEEPKEAPKPVREPGAAFEPSPGTSPEEITTVNEKLAYVVKDPNDTKVNRMIAEIEAIEARKVFPLVINALYALDMKKESDVLAGHKFIQYLGIARGEDKMRDDDWFSVHGRWPKTEEKVAEEAKYRGWAINSWWRWWEEQDKVSWKPTN